MSLDMLRSEMDEINSQILELFLKRMELSKEICLQKKALSLPVLDSLREEEILAGIENSSGKMAPYSRELFVTLMELSKKFQTQTLTEIKNGRNIVLIGMPGCGKTTVGQRLADISNRPFIDTDTVLESKCGKAAGALLAEIGEEEFRRLEGEAVKEAGKLCGRIIATGGGVATRPENYDTLHKNGVIYFIDRPIELLATEGRPLSADLQRLYNDRIDLYHKFCDRKIKNCGTVDDTAEEIWKDFLKNT